MIKVFIIYLVYTLIDIMSLKLETKLQTVGRTGTLITSIPKPIVKHFGLKKGDKMNVYIKGNHIIMEKQE